MESQTSRVAVYGTLKKHQSNHRLLAGQRRLGRCQLDAITLYDLGPYPAAKLVPSEGVDVEVYEVSRKCFARLDRLEDYNAAMPEAGLYDRVELETEFGPAWVYIYNRGVGGCRVIRSGGWVGQS